MKICIHSKLSLTIYIVLKYEDLLIRKVNEIYYIGLSGSIIVDNMEEN